LRGGGGNLAMSNKSANWQGFFPPPIGWMGNRFVFSDKSFLVFEARAGKEFLK
jgi:hypothetical protein